MENNGIIMMGIKFIMRGILGMVIIYFINIFLNQEGIDAQVGMNFVTFLASGSLGIPGVAMLYGITFFQIL